LTDCRKKFTQAIGQDIPWEDVDAEWTHEVEIVEEEDDDALPF
jgi:hypothetical protein